MSYNIYDIAKKAGTSTATVSRVINKSKNVSDKTRKKVLAVISELDYEPSDTARALAINKTMTIGVMVPDVRDPFHSESSFVIEQLLSEKGYMTILCNTGTNINQKINYFKMLYKKQVDGIILVGSDYGDRRLKTIYSKVIKQIPIVSINGELDDESYSVICDEYYGMKQSVEFMVDNNFKKPIYIGERKKEIFRSSRNKFQSFKKLSNKYFNINNNIYLIKKTKNDIQNIVEIIKNKNIDIIQFESDNLALRFSKELVAANINIPEDISIIGFDNINLSLYNFVTLTTIDQKIKKLSETATYKLLSIIDNEKVEHKEVIKPNLIIRDSTIKGRL